MIKDHCVFFSAELTKQALYLTAFPLLTALYGYRGLKGVVPSVAEKKAAKLLKTTPETLIERYSLLLPVGFLVISKACDSIGVVSLFCAMIYDIIPEIEGPELFSYLDKAGVVGDVFEWISGLAGVAALGIWTNKRQKERKSSKNTKKWLIGAPEVSLAAFSFLFYSATSAPCSDNVLLAIQSYMHKD